MNKIKPNNFLQQSRQLVEQSVKLSLTDFNKAFTTIINNYSNVEFELDGVSPQELSNEIIKMFNEAQPITYQKKIFDRDGDETIINKKLFKKPSSLSSRLITKLADAEQLHEKELLIRKKQIEFQRVLKIQIPATLPEAQTALKAVLYPTKITNIKESLIYLISWINNLKNNTEQKKVLLYQSQDADGTFRGGNGKSYITNKILDACNRLGIPCAAENIPGWHTSEISEVFAKSVICLAEEQQLKVPQNPANQIIDNNIYNTKIKYQSALSLKSVANFLGTTNQSLINADQTMQRRVSLIKCNEDFNAEEYIKSHKGVLPDGEEIVKAWMYLLTRDLTVLKIDNNSKYEQTTAISTTELNILYKLVEVVAAIKNDRTNVFTLGNIKEKMNDDKIFLSSIYDVLIKYGATHYKNGLHGKKPDSYTAVDITNLNIPTDIFDSVNHNPLEVYAAIEELVYIE